MHLFSQIIVNTHGNKHIFIVIVITVSIKSLRICWGHEYDHTFYRVTPHMCTICGMRNRYLRCLFLIDFVIIRKRVPQVAELPSSACIALPGVRVTKPIFSVPLFSHFFRMIKTVVTCMISSSYLAGVTAAELRRHLANMNMIEIIWLILLLNQNFP